MLNWTHVSVTRNLQGISISRAKKLNLTKLFDLLARLPKLHALSLTDGSYSVLPGNISSLTTLDLLISKTATSRRCLRVLPN
jgi:hypothetical protein